MKGSKVREFVERSETVAQVAPAIISCRRDLRLFLQKRMRCGVRKSLRIRTYTKKGRGYLQGICSQKRIPRAPHPITRKPSALWTPIPPSGRQHERAALWYNDAT